MKKIVMLVGTLVLCTASFGALKDSDTIDVTAQVAEHLDVKATDVDFGIVTAGKTKGSPDQEGSITINGETNRVVRVSLVDQSDSILNTLNLVGVNDKTSVLEYKPEMKLQGISIENGSTVRLGYGVANIDVVGSLNVPQSARSGEHKGTMVVEVEYAD